MLLKVWHRESAKSAETFKEKAQKTAIDVQGAALIWHASAETKEQFEVLLSQDWISQLKLTVIYVSLMNMRNLCKKHTRQEKRVSYICQRSFVRRMSRGI